MKIVIALGGNALGNSFEEQLQLLTDNMGPIVNLIEEGHEIVISHGNGPQVGMILKAFEENSSIPNIELPEATAMSQGYIGYHLQQVIKNELNKRQINKNVISLVTQIIVDKDDKAFDHPTKPIGSYFSKEEAEELERDKGFFMMEDAGRGYRRAVASPKPIDIIEKDLIKDLSQDNIIIATGGGGIPVVDKNSSYSGLASVIDKDFASAKLAELIGADMLMILTAVEHVALNFNKKDQVWLDHMTLDQAKQYRDEGHFLPGSMLPKVEACIGFIENNPGKKAIITSLAKAEEGFKHQTGTLIEK